MGTRCALGWGGGVGMHDLMFRFKRAHLSAVAFGKLLLRKFGLTPARFDVLYVVVSNGNGVLQSDIWEALGLHRSTISKMCKRLEELGLVERFEAHARGHETIVQLTYEGITVVDKVMKYVFMTEGPRFAFGTVLSRIEPDVEAFISKLRRLTERAARNLGDTSTLLYPIHQPREATIDKVFKRLQRIWLRLLDKRKREQEEAERRKKNLEELCSRPDNADDYDDDGDH